MMNHPESGQNGLLRILNLVSEFAALCHDLGKSTSGFQTKLRTIFENRNKKSDLAIDPVRHELISVIILSYLFSSVEKHGWTFLMTEQGVKRWFTENAHEALKDHSEEYFRLKDRIDNDHESASDVFYQTTAPQPFDLAKFESNTVLSSILWLVLTHHKLPKNLAYRKEKSGRRRRSQSEEETIDLRSTVLGYINTDVMDRLDDFFEIANLEDPGHPWNNPKWCRRIATVARKLDQSEESFPKINFLEPSPWVAGMIYMARPAVIFADHTSSANKSAHSSNPKTNSIFANTFQTKGPTYWLADPLDIHLQKTGNESARYFAKLFQKNDQDIDQLESIDKTAVSDDLIANNAPEPYQWQNHLGTVAQACQGHPSLSFVMAETGTGKTRGCIKLAYELSDKELRCTVGLGLRTLADQTYNDYLQFPISLPENQVGRLIGSYYPVRGEGEESIGTSASEETGQMLLFNGQNNQWHELPSTRIFQGKKKGLFSKAVTSMTIDNIIQAVSVRSGADTHILMHLMHSDLVIDEIDNFSPSDLSFVTVLIHIMGLYGRNVILATATINQVIVQSMSEAYHAGLEKRGSILGNKLGGKVAFVRSKSPYFKVADLNGNAGDVYEQFLLEEDPPGEHKPPQRRQSEVLEVIRHGDDKTEAFQPILERIQYYSRTHFEPSYGIAFSTGFIRFNTVRNAQEFAYWLSEQGRQNDLHIELICYHSKTTSFERYIQEYYLNHLMKRKGQPLPDDIEPDFRRFSERVRSSGKKRGVLVVVTTNIIEVGRDHDYDWCILEPSSLASFVQSIGRVLRHRKEKTPSQANVSVLNAPIKMLSNKTGLWAYPGIETPDASVDEYGRQGFYELCVSPKRAIKDRLEKMGLDSGEDGPVEPVTRSESLLGPALINPSNRWVLRKPERFESLPEHALNLVRLNDYLCQDGIPANKRRKQSINAGNIVGYSGFQLALALGDIVQFRDGPDQIQLICRTIDGTYSNDWICSPGGHRVAVSLLDIPREEAFFLEHIDRSRFVEYYRRCFTDRHVRIKNIQSQLFQVTVYSSDSDDLNFNRHLGMCRQSNI